MTGTAFITTALIAADKIFSLKQLLKYDNI